VTDPPTEAPPPPHLAVEVRREPGCRRVVSMFGELDLAGEDYVWRVLGAVDGRRVVIDLAGLEFIDARGVAALLHARQRLQSTGGQLEVRGARGVVRRVLVLLQLDGLLESA
jgi:anti-anti-sigma factor